MLPLSVHCRCLHKAVGGKITATCWSSTPPASVSSCLATTSPILKFTLTSGCLSTSASSKGTRAKMIVINEQWFLQIYQINGKFFEGSLTPVWTLWGLTGRLSNQTHGWCLCWSTSHRGGPSFRRSRAVWTIRPRSSLLLISQVRRVP